MAITIDPQPAGSPSLSDYSNQIHDTSKLFEFPKGAGVFGEPINRIQALCGHKDKAATEIYVKQQWRESVASNSRKIGS